jgi:hypothetical protein
MYFVITATLIVAIIFFIREQRDWDDWFNSLGISLAAAIITLIVSSLIVAVCFTGAAYDENKFVPIETTETELVALNDNMGITGVRYLCSGYINEELEYTYLYNVPGKGITSGSVKADECYIIESENPKLVTTTYAINTNRFVDFFTFDFLLQKTEYTLFVPNGSIVAASEYKIDLE